MESKYHFNFEELKVYKKAIEYGELVHEQINHFPKIEDYRLSAQFGVQPIRLALILQKVQVVQMQAF